MKKATIVICSLALLSSLWAESKSIFLVDTTKSLIYSSTMLGLDVLNNYIDPELINKPSQADIDQLNKDDLLFFDQISFQPMSQSIKDFSDYTVYFTIAATGVMAYDSDYWMDNLLVLSEITVTQSALAKWTKTLSSRYRPFVYDSEISLSKKRQYNSQHSFYSMHSSTAFSMATFGYYYYYHKNGASWPVALLLYVPATATAALRVACANHFVSDVTVGAIIGSAISYYICKQHTNSNNLNITLSSNQLGLIYRF